MTRRRYLLEPLASAAGLSMARLGRRLGLTGSSWQAVRDRGVGEKAADRYAVKLGLAAFNVWPEMIDHHIEDEQARRRAQWAASKRRRYRTDPAVREKQAAYLKQYRQDCRDTLNAQRRAWREANRERHLANHRAAQARYRARRKQAAA